MDCSLPGSSIHGISQARILEWVSISFSRGSSEPRDWTCVSCLAGRSFIIEPQGKSLLNNMYYCYYYCPYYYKEAMVILSFIIYCTLKYSSKWNSLISIFSWHSMCKKRYKLCDQLFLPIPFSKASSLFASYVMTILKYMLRVGHDWVTNCNTAQQVCVTKWRNLK